jgi:DNA-binding MarR family transcriptional regulator
MRRVASDLPAINSLADAERLRGDLVRALLEGPFNALEDVIPTVCPSVPVDEAIKHLVYEFHKGFGVRSVDSRVMAVIADRLAQTYAVRESTRFSKARESEAQVAVSALGASLCGWSREHFHTYLEMAVYRQLGRLRSSEINKLMKQFASAIKPRTRQRVVEVFQRAAGVDGERAELALVLRRKALGFGGRKKRSTSGHKREGVSLDVLKVLVNDPDRWWRGQEMRDAAGINIVSLGNMLRRWEQKGWMSLERNKNRGKQNPWHVRFRLTESGIEEAQNRLFLNLSIGNRPEAGFGRHLIDKAAPRERIRQPTSRQDITLRVLRLLVNDPDHWWQGKEMYEAVGAHHSALGSMLQRWEQKGWMSLERNENRGKQNLWRIRFRLTESGMEEAQGRLSGSLFRAKPPTFSVLWHLVEDPNRWWYGTEMIDKSGIKDHTLSDLLRRMKSTGWIVTEKSGAKLFFQPTEVGLRQIRSFLSRHMSDELGLAHPLPTEDGLEV